MAVQGHSATLQWTVLLVLSLTVAVSSEGFFKSIRQVAAAERRHLLDDPEEEPAEVSAFQRQLNDWSLDVNQKKRSSQLEDALQRSGKYNSDQSEVRESRDYLDNDDVFDDLREEGDKTIDYLTERELSEPSSGFLRRSLERKEVAGKALRRSLGEKKSRGKKALEREDKEYLDILGRR